MVLPIQPLPSVKLEEADRVWSVTFVSLPGNVATLTATSSLTGTSPTVSVATRRDGTSRPLEGKIKVAFGGSGWATIFANNTEQEVSDTLNGLGIDVSVERVFLVGGASSTLITFREPRGDVPLIKVNASGLVGTGAIARVDEVFNTKTAVLVVDYKQKVNPRQHRAVENDNDASEEDIEREAAVEVIQEFEGGAERIDE